MTTLITALLVFFVGLRMINGQWGWWTWLGIFLIVANVIIDRNEAGH